MEYQRIKYFLKAAETENFSQAAKQLYISPQALTKQINLLEQELGTTLFVRSAKGATLTDIGHYTHTKLQRIDHSLDMAIQDIHAQIENTKRKLQIGFFAPLPKDTFVSPIISLILAEFPEYQLELNMVDLFEARSMMLGGKLDILFTNTHSQEDWPEMKKHVFGNFEAKIIVSLLHPWAVKDEITVKDMKQETFLKMARPVDDYNLPSEISFYENVPCKNIEPVNGFSAMQAMLKQGKSFAVFPLAFSDYEHEKYKYFDYPGKAIAFETAAIYPAATENECITEIIQLLTDEFSMEV